MHSLVAIDPEIMNNWPDIRYLADKLGYEKGVLLAHIPENWFKTVFDSCMESGVSGMDRTRIEAKLAQLKFERSIKIAYKINLSNYPRMPWIENFSSPNARDLLDALIIDDRRPYEIAFNYDDSVDCEKLEVFFSNAVSKRIQRSAAEIAKSAEYLILGEREISLVDPYFFPEKKNTKIILSLDEIAMLQGGVLKKYNIHCSYEAYKKNRGPFERTKVRKEFKKLLSEMTNRGVEFDIQFWSKRDGGSGDIHGRYLLTNKGGLLYDRGFVEPYDHDDRQKLSPVQVISKKFSQETLDTFDIDNQELIRVDRVYIK